MMVQPAHETCGTTAPDGSSQGYDVTRVTGISYDRLQRYMHGRRDSIHHRLPEVILKAETVPELRQKPLYTTFLGVAVGAAYKFAPPN